MSHQSHTSHANTATHSNSLYSAEGDVSYAAPQADSIPGIQAPASTTDAVVLPNVNQNIQLPNGTPVTSILPSFAVPASSVETKIDPGKIKIPSPTDKV